MRLTSLLLLVLSHLELGYLLKRMQSKRTKIVIILCMGLADEIIGDIGEQEIITQVQAIGQQEAEEDDHADGGKARSCLPAHQGAQFHMQLCGKRFLLQLLCQARPFECERKASLRS